MTTAASKNATTNRDRSAGSPRPRVTAPPQTRRPGAPPSQASRGPGPVRRVRIGSRTPATAPGPERPLGEAAAPAPARLPDPTALCCSVVRAAVEVLRGERPAAQIARWVTPRVHDQLVERARLVQARARRDGSPAPTSVPVVVRRVRMVRLGDGTAEATVVLDDAGRVRAAAARLEAHRGLWRVAVLELG